MNEPEFEIDSTTGELKLKKRKIDDTQRSFAKHLKKTFKGKPQKIYVETMHISCQSDTYQPGHNYGGVIIYQYDGKSDWKTANNTHCKTGYIVVQDADSDNVQTWISEESGVVQRAVYRNAFGESAKDVEVVGESFAILYGQFEKNSHIFNNPHGSAFHEDRREMDKLSEHCVRKIVEYWKRVGSSRVEQRNFEVKELLQDFD
ncbi:Hypothetical predicted protein, partial [Paramuricea clavata]